MKQIQVKGDKKIEYSDSSLGRIGIWIIFVYSLLAHKEFRFIMPVLPILVVYSGLALERISKKNKTIIASIIILNIIPAYYLSFVHQRGVIDVMYHLRNNQLKDVLFLMPCHSRIITESL